MTEHTADRITEAEQAVLEVLWDTAPLTAAQVAEKIGDTRGWSLATVKTLLSRLAAKDAVASEPDGRRFLYSPLIARDSFARAESRRLVDRLFGGRPGALFAHLAESEALSERDLAEIETLLKDLRATGEGQ